MQYTVYVTPLLIHRIYLENSSWGKLPTSQLLSFSLTLSTTSMQSSWVNEFSCYGKQSQLMSTTALEMRDKRPFG